MQTTGFNSVKNWWFTPFQSSRQPVYILEVVPTPTTFGQIPTRQLARLGTN